MKPLTVALAFASTALAARTLGAQSLDTTITVRSGARFELTSVSGSVRIRSWNRSAIRVNAESDGARVNVDASPLSVSVRSIPRRGEGNVDFTISVPTGTALEIHTISADIDAAGVNGDARLASISGGVTLAGSSGDVEAESVSGDVSASDIRGGRIDVASTSGDVVVRQARGDLNARSVSGDVSLEQVDAQDVGVETVSGDVGFAGPIHESGRYRFRSHSGDITLRVAGELNAAVDVSTFSGDLEPDWPITVKPGRMHPREWEFTVGNGSARLELESFSGTIYLRRGTAPRREDR
jgi:DUF4097 and DUF4098 domain-containing protein YvlB